MARQRLGDLDELLLGHDQVAHGVSGDRCRPTSASTSRVAARIAVSSSQPMGVELAAEEHVLRHREVFREVELLVDQHDARGLGLARIPEPAGRRRHREFTAARLLVAREDLHQRGLARAVFTQQAVARGQAPGRS